MFDITELVELPKLQKDYFVHDVNIRTSDGTIVLYISVEHVSENAKSGFVSRKQLDNLSCQLSEKYSVPTAVIITPSPKLEKIGQAAELLLKAKFGEIIEEANFSFLSSEKVNAWIKLIQQNNLVSDIESYLQSILTESGVQFLSCQWVGNNMLPTPMNILLTIKRLQPVNIEAFIEHLDTDYLDLNAKWLNRQLDKMLKKQLVIRDKVTGNYSLTGLGLGLIPSVHGRFSSDITRALALGRRKW